jgi:hypothetical protein
MSKALIEGLKEIGRTALMAVIPLIVIDLGQNKFNYQAWGIALLIAVLSGVDKWLHKLDEGVNGNGLTGF